MCGLSFRQHNPLFNPVKFTGGAFMPHLTVKNRLVLILAGVLVIFAVIGTTAWFSTSKTGRAVSLARAQSEKVDRILEIRDNILATQVHALRSIQAYGALGIVPQELMTLMKAGVASMENSLPVIAGFAAEIGKEDLVQTAADAVAADKKILEKDLPGMMFMGGSDKDLLNLQNNLEQNTETLSDVLTQIMQPAKVEVENALGAAETVSVQGTILMVLVVVLAAAGLTPAMFFAIRSIVAPLTRLQSDMGRMVEGDLEVEIADAKRHDELGHMAKALQVFRDNAYEQLQLKEESELAGQQKALRQAQVERLIADFRNKVVQRLSLVNDGMSTLGGSAKSLQGAVESSAEQSEGAASASENASSSVQMVAAAAEELAASIAEIDRQVRQTSQAAEEATQVASETNGKVSGLSEGAQKIGDVVSLIQAIAEQTNLLALNATIEAARAGEAGRGFAVVAAEVKELADQTSKATEEISHQIATIQSATGETVSAIELISQKIEGVNSFAAMIATAVSQQGAATSEISQNVNTAAQGTQKATDNITSVYQTSSELKVSSQEMTKVTDDIRAEAQALEDEISGFLTEVAAA